MTKTEHKSGIRLQGDGLTLAADEWGHPGQPTVIFLHGGGQTRHSWKHAGRDLARAGFHVLSIDHRGHGDSDWSAEGRYGAQVCALDLLSVLEQVDGQVILVGASLGGLTSLLANAAAPERVRALVLVDITTRPEPKGGERIHRFMTGAPDGFASLDEAADAVADYLPHRKRPRSTAGLLKNLRQRENGRWYWHWDPAMFSTENNVRQMAAREHLEAAAAAVTVPTLLIRGMLSDIVSDEGVAELRSQIPHVEVFELDRAAHTAAADDNDEFSAAVVEFCQRITAA